MVVEHEDSPDAHRATGTSDDFNIHSSHFRRLALGYALVAPVVLWRLATSIYPFFYTAYLSFFESSPVRRVHTFIGFDNYAAMVRDSNVHDTIIFTIFFSSISVALQVVFGLGVAELLNRQFRGQKHRPRDQSVAMGDLANRHWHRCWLDVQPGLWSRE